MKCLGYNNLKDKPFNQVVFADTATVENSIWVIYGRFLPHFLINKTTAAQAVAIVKQQVALQSDARVEFTQQKLATFKTFSYIKMKAIEYTEGYKQYVTYYFISSKKKTFIVKILNVEDKDYQSLINQTVFR